MKRGLKIFLFANSIFYIATGMLGPIYAIFVQRVGGDILEAGSAWSIFMFVSGIGIYFMGKLQDRIGREKQVILISTALGSFGILGYVFVETTIQLFIIQIILGIGGAISAPASDSYYTKFLEKGKFASQWAAWESVYRITSAIAALFGALMASMYGFKALFITMFFISLISLLILTRIEEV